jgi:hypothetical protein
MDMFSSSRALTNAFTASSRRSSIVDRATIAISVLNDRPVSILGKQLRLLIAPNNESGIHLKEVTMSVEFVDIDPFTVGDFMTFHPWVPKADLGPRFHEFIAIQVINFGLLE